MEKPRNRNWFNSLFENRAFQIAFGLAALVLAYVFASWAIDSGSLLDYAITFMLIVFGLREIVLSLRSRR